jgi:hypothetical protein
MRAHRKFTVRDPNLEHQVVLTQNQNSIVVSCNCLWVPMVAEHAPDGKFTNKEGGYFTPIGISHDAADTKRLYNNPESHKKQFGKEWELTYEV